MSSTHEENDHEHRRRYIGASLRIPNHAVVRCVEAAMQPDFPEVRQANLVVFQQIDHPPGGSRLTTLADRAQMTKQAMIELVDGLERSGYVTRIPDPSDRRAKLVCLTEKGERVMDRAGEAVGALEEEWARALGQERFDAMLDSLKALVDYLQPDPYHG